ncbi:MAG TPA: redoxin family protein [Chloroflexota bacterium]|nr:redoxin family protein [Chloroflexota bacterium]
MTANRAQQGSRKARRQEARQAAKQVHYRRTPAWRISLTRYKWLVGGALVVVAVVALLVLSQRQKASQLAIGSPAPSGTFTTVNGQTASTASLRGKPTLLWFVTTWCPSCQSGTQVMAQNIRKLHADGVRVEELELYNNLGGQGPDVPSFQRSYAGRAAYNPSWGWGIASQQLSSTYDPKGYLDIYYLLDANGNISYINGSPGATMPSLLRAASQV